ncbi:Golgi transport complex subunit COG5 Ecym_3298 [Eremothecium cymbalariae DBVPG|uniref:Conserved oligomeric Golgi complex subunit 5 n=1 Tax=Eremothecium cymbalariae (strain CBS 270.75 / DBVPG 7215 / KCTC 17166 / NRRL Y-17582) TaxID=931890 RepID=G8JRM1_ERECY|nr:Hypothetical protein Ecym_3298 [Eremothecium cymbalariae DBVPG\
MSSDDELEDFEALLEDNFNPIQFANELTKAINNNLDSKELDFNTPLKKVKYDMIELDKRTDQIIKDNPLLVLEQLEKRKLQREKVGPTLKPSLDYLSMSFERLNNEVLKPYDRAQKLQSALGKIHQTSFLLRDALIYIQMATQIESLPLNADDQPGLIRLATLYSKIEMNLNQNHNLKSLQLIKKFENGPLKNKKIELIRNISQSLIKDCVNNHKIKHNLESIQTLALNLNALSTKDYTATLDKIALLKIQSSQQALTRTTVSIRSLGMAMSDAVKNGYWLSQLESLLKTTKLEDSSLLNEYLAEKKYRSITKNYWIKVANAFQKDFETSYRRGGPVGKSLISNTKFIKDTITEAMPKSTNDENYKDYLDIMLSSVSILDSNMRKSS